MQHLEGLNREQYLAATHVDGPLLIVAGAGTGKTKTIVHRILNLVTLGIHPSSILAITFTNKAAKEMQERIAKALVHQESYLLVSTFHSLGVRILREHSHVLGINKYFTILDSADSKSIVKEAMEDLSIDPKMWDPGKIAHSIGKAKGDGIKLSEYQVSSPQSDITKQIWTRYEVLKRNSHALDFADLLSMTYELLADNPEILKSYQQRFHYVHVDEYQDTNTIQYNIVKLLVKEHRNLCAVGDGDQNIYSWRGADLKNILNFEKDFPEAQVILLETNYRSTGIILEASHEIISRNTERIPKKLVTDNPTGKKVLLYEAFSGNQEAQWVAQKVRDYINQGTKAQDIAVLFRTNFQSRILEEAFLYQTIPYHVVGVKFFARKEIKDILSYLRLSLNESSLADMKRVINEPKRGLGKVAVAKIFSGQPELLTGKAKVSYQEFKDVMEAISEYALEHLPSETIKFILYKTGLEKVLSQGTEEERERLSNIQELVTYATKYDDEPEPLEKFLEEVSLLSDQDSMDAQQESQGGTVKLMTIHAAKGLEFKYVFVVGLEQGLFPSTRDQHQTKYEAEEERRLCYVAFTRAKERLHLSFARIRTIYGEERINEASEFIRDLPEELLEYDEEDGETYVPTMYLDF
jgi:DNA helicase-2/ATP-dependent DNA helicase PcrA